MGRPVSSVALVIVMLAAAACGSTSSATSTNPAGSGTGSPPAASTASPEIHDQCNHQIGKWMRALKALNSRLDIGLTDSRELGDISVIYHEIDFNSLSPQCLVPGVKAEKAFNDYIDASNAWSKCFASLTCTNAKVRPKLQSFWAAAARQLDKANTDLQKLQG